jgi:two-component system, OmpR family, sensor histidine kinase SenX3
VADRRENGSHSAGGFRLFRPPTCVTGRSRRILVEVRAHPWPLCHIGYVLGYVSPFPGIAGLNHTQEILVVVGAAVVFVLALVVAVLLGRRSGRRAIAQRLAALGNRLGLDPPEDEYNIETSLAYLEQVTGGAAQAVTEASSDAIRLRRSLDTLTQGVVLCDENGTVIYRNERANALMVSRHGDALAAQAVTELLEDAWHEGAAERTLDLYGPPRRTLQVRASQIDDGRRPLGVIALIEDISKSRRLEEIRRDFVANVSHELKTPMGALGLLAETLVSEPDPDVAHRLAGRIHNEAFRVSRIIDDLLDLSRIESEEAPPREPVLVNLVMADAIERVRATADQRGIEIVLHEPSPPVAVMGERRQLISAMHALLENAITYSYDNSKVVVTGTLERASSAPSAAHPSQTGANGESDITLHGTLAAPGAPGAGTSTFAGTSTEKDDEPVQPVFTPELLEQVRRAADDEDHRKSAAERAAQPFDAEAEVSGPLGSSPPAESTESSESSESSESTDSTDSIDSAASTPPARPESTFLPDTGSTPAVLTASPATATAAPAATAAPETATSTAPNWRIEARDNIRLSVQDHGVGIPARDLDRIFERFYRVDHGRSRDTGGTGLGLAIVRHVANNHQGWVDVESREGEGSTFSLVLPVKGERVA